MTCLISRVLTKATFLESSYLANFPRGYSKVSSFANLTGSAPSQLPLVGTPEWDAILKNIEAYQQQPPLFRSDIEEKQRLFTIEKRMDLITDALGDVMKSNNRLQEIVNRMIKYQETRY